MPNSNTKKIEGSFYLKFDDSKKSYFPGYCVFQNGGKTRQRVFIRKYLLDQNDSDCKESTRDLDVLRKSAGCHGNLQLHENFIRFIVSVEDKIYLYAATEFCQYSLEDIFRDSGKADNSVIATTFIRRKLGAKEILRQSTEGLAFLHGLGFLHRNLKPSNFRIASYNNEIYQIKITDFRKSKNFFKILTINSGTLGTNGWIAPECVQLGSALHQSVDVFILGTLYYYVLSGGVHPFDRFEGEIDEKNDQATRIQNKHHKIYTGDWTSRQHRVQQNYWMWWNTVIDLSIPEKQAEETLLKNAMDLIKQMVRLNPDDRINLKKILDHEFFKPINLQQYEIYDNNDCHKPGLLTIFYHTKFVDEKDETPFHEHSKEYLSKVLKTFGFDVLVYRNLDARCIENTILNLAKDHHTLRIYNSLCVCVLSHGKSGKVIGSDGKKVSIPKIQYCFNSHDCPAMHDKPKIFIFQSCRVPSPSIKLGSLEIDVKLKNKSDKTTHALETSAESDNLSPINDFICIMSTKEGCEAYAWSEDFINTLCCYLEQEGEKPDLEVVLCKAQNDMGKKSWPKKGQDGTKKFKTEFVQTPERTSSLRKHIVFEKNRREGQELN